VQEMKKKTSEGKVLSEESSRGKPWRIRGCRRRVYLYFMETNMPSGEISPEKYSRPKKNILQISRG